ncbi:Na+/H+ antiporter [Sphingobacterium composti Ten et al. 2007 non Yoo et al. 2007]|uniref:Na+/H+ antiporter n=1 Tax=Sphingobacterium composti TaxID=363260 RepID=UPI0013582B9F|nr:Na+/H+ antiporter [Sphingobacterium composti Ten et al. 2007 non Yoo et al. 2007]
MHHQILLVLGLLFAVIHLVMLAQRIRVAYPIFLVIAGLAISFIPGMPVLHLEPDLIFLIFLPPLLYEAAWYTSWKDFWKWRRPIALLAFGLVFFTSMVVAYASNAFIPGFTLALGFLLGGIVSPPDAVAAATVLKGMKVPKRLMTILEGESLVNDASTLIVFKFAVLAVLSGTFSMQEATGQFFIVAGMGIVVGLVGANIMYAIHRFLPTTPAIDAALTVMTPYILFLAAEQFHFSGVMAVVSGGLFMSYRAHEVFNTGSTRLNMLGVWTTMIFLMNALVFILIGLELPEIVAGLGEYSIADGIKYGLIISVIVILLRYLWVYPAAHLPRLLSPKARKDPSPGWKGPLVISWAGMRGVVSLATALSIPLMLNETEAFPQRNLIIFITFVVIFVTLVFQGLTLPFVIKLINLKEIDNIANEEEQRALIQIRLGKVALNHINEKYNENLSSNELIQFYKENLEDEISNTKERLNSLECSHTAESGIELYHQMLLEIIAQQRKELFLLKKDPICTDEEIRHAEFQLDLEELKITGIQH